MGCIGLPLIPSCFDENSKRDPREINKSSAKYSEKMPKNSKFLQKNSFFQWYCGFNGIMSPYVGIIGI